MRLFSLFNLTTAVSITFSFTVFSGRGGQSALRFARLRLEKRRNYLRKVAELATQAFISNDKCNVTGLILAGSADFKTELSRSDLFDPVRPQSHLTDLLRLHVQLTYVL